MLYSTGTIAINGNTATGTGTNWTAPASQIRVGQTLFVLSNPLQMFQITAINSATSLTITPAASPALSGQKYGILVTDSLSVDGLAQSMSQLINEYDENIGAWETFATTSANQSITVTINGTPVTIPGIGKLAQKGSNGAIPIGQGGTGATNTADARKNLGLGTSAARDEQVSMTDAAPDRVMMTGKAFGIGSLTGINTAIGSAGPIGFYGSTGDNWGTPGGLSVGFGVIQMPGSNAAYRTQLALTNSGKRMFMRATQNNIFDAWIEFYSTGNTTKASDGTLKAASPVIKIFANGDYHANDESEGCTVTRLGTGEYLIEGCMGMNSDAAWGGIDGGFDIPKDRNGQALIWLDYEVHADGAVLVKTYHRTHPGAPEFARNELDGVSNGDPVDIPRDQFVSVRVEMPADSLYNQKIRAAELAMTADAGE